MSAAILKPANALHKRRHHAVETDRFPAQTVGGDKNIVGPWPVSSTA
jgi:hypothetical protein